MDFAEILSSPLFMTVAIGLVIPALVLKLAIGSSENKAIVNKTQAKEQNEDGSLKTPKVVDVMDLEEIAEKCEGGKKCVMCRCWKSKKVRFFSLFSLFSLGSTSTSQFPYCDGSHNAHNKETGDNVGPLIIEQKEVEQKED